MKFHKVKRPVILILIVVILTILQATIANNFDNAYAQQDFGIRQGFGIPIVEVTISIAAVLALYGTIIAFVKQRKSQVVIGSIVALSSMIIIAMITPVYMHSNYAGPSHRYCEDNSCDERDGNSSILNIAGYQDLSQRTTLNKAVSAARSEGLDNSATTTISYFEELSFYQSAGSAIKLNSSYSYYDEQYLFKFRNEYYTLSFRHLDDYFNHTYPGTIFTINTFYLMTVIPALSFFSIVLPRTSKLGNVKSTPSPIPTNSSENKGVAIVLRWLAARRVTIPVIGVAILVSTYLVSLWLGSDHHQSTWDILNRLIISLLAFLAIILVARAIQRRKTSVAKQNDGTGSNR